MKVLNFSRFMKLNESKGEATKIKSIKLKNGKTINFFKSKTIDPDTKKAVIQPAFDIDGKNMSIFYPNGKCKTGLCNKDNATVLNAFGAKGDSIAYNDYIKVIMAEFKKLKMKVNIKSINL